MPYKTEKLYNDSIKYITENNLFFIDDIIAYLGISKQTFYDHFPVDSDHLDYLKALLSENKSKTKVSIRSKLHKGKGVELIALYKLLATREELDALNGTTHNNTTQSININLVDSLFPTDNEIDEASNQ
jgi:hypothetical protein